MIVHGLTIFSSASIEYAKTKPEYEGSTDQVVMINLTFRSFKGQAQS